MADEKRAEERSDRGAVVVTGSSTGIGRATALYLDDLGFRVFAGVRKDADADSLRSEASKSLTPVMIDVTDERSIDKARAQVAGAVGDRGLAGLVNNAGVAIAGPLEFLPIEDLRRQLDVNLFGHFSVTQAFLELLRKASGRIVNIGSIGGRLTWPLNGPYHMSKYGMEAFSDTLRVELQPWGIDVALIEPGTIATEIWARGAASAGEARAKIDRRGEELYGEMMDAVAKASEETGARGIAPKKVAKVVADALTSRRPDTRYLVGADAKVMARARRVLGDRAWDRAVTRVMKVPRRGSASG